VIKVTELKYALNFSLIITPAVIDKLLSIKKRKHIKKRMKWENGIGLCTQRVSGWNAGL
jgi:hypothetical protein